MDMCPFFSSIILFLSWSCVITGTLIPDDVDGLVLNSVNRAAASARSNNGLCSRKVHKVFVSNERALLSARKKYLPSDSVRIYLRRKITLSKPFFINALWSCTSFVTDKPGITRTIRYPKDNGPAIFIVNTNNILLFEVNVEHTVTERSKPCNKTLFFKFEDYNDKNPVCGAVHIWRSWGVKIYKASVLGRIDILRSARVHLDSLTVFAPAYMYVYPPIKGLSQTPSVIRIMFSGNNIRLIRANIMVTNCEIFGGHYGVIILRDTAGVVVKNNYFHNFTVSAVSCGQNVNNAADCMLTTISNNYITYEPWVPLFFDGAGIYFDTHWVNPGNYITCNYVNGGRFCIYLDFVSSGVPLDGGVCYNSVNGNKVNTGKGNKFTSLLFYNVSFSTGKLSCQNWEINNCNSFPGEGWANAYRNASAKFPAWGQITPYLNKLCTRTKVNGYLCNQPGSGSSSDSKLSGNCSGFPTENSLDHILVGPNNRNPPSFDPRSCSTLPNIKYMNTVTSVNLTSQAIGFDNITAGDFGLSNLRSPLYQAVKNFKSCPRSRVGVLRELYVPRWLQSLSNKYRMP